MVAVVRCRLRSHPTAAIWRSANEAVWIRHWPKGISSVGNWNEVEEKASGVRVFEVKNPLSQWLNGSEKLLAQ